VASFTTRKTVTENPNASRYTTTRSLRIAPDPTSRLSRRQAASRDNP